MPKSSAVAAVDPVQSLIDVFNQLFAKNDTYGRHAHAVLVDINALQSDISAEGIPMSPSEKRRIHHRQRRAYVEQPARDLMTRTLSQLLKLHCAIVSGDLSYALLSKVYDELVFQRLIKSDSEVKVLISELTNIVGSVQAMDENSLEQFVADYNRRVPAEYNRFYILLLPPPAEDTELTAAQRRVLSSTTRMPTFGRSPVRGDIRAHAPYPEGLLEVKAAAITPEREPGGEQLPDEVGGVDDMLVPTPFRISASVVGQGLSWLTGPVSSLPPFASEENAPLEDGGRGGLSWLGGPIDSLPLFANGDDALLGTSEDETASVGSYGDTGDSLLADSEVYAAKPKRARVS